MFASQSKASVLHNRIQAYLFEEGSIVYHCDSASPATYLTSQQSSSYPN
jgi:hypothetical protein